MNIKTIAIKEYLDKKGIVYKEASGELIAKCVFCGKDDHLYFSKKTGQYDCKICGEQGNIFTLAEHMGDKIKDIAVSPLPAASQQKRANFDHELVESCHLALPAHIRQYLNARGISDAIIDQYSLGWGKFYGKTWITIPIKDKDGAFRFFKLRQDPAAGDEKITYPKGIEAQIYDWEMLNDASETMVICEGEMDRLLLLSKGVPAVTSTHGAMTFKEEWAEEFKNFKKAYICFDNDDAGRKGAERAAKIVGKGGIETYIINLPPEVGDKGDITDYFQKLNGNLDDLFEKYAKPYPEKIDTSHFKPISSQELINTLGLTIKKDEENKLITFLGQLSAYSETSQLNISFNAPSSTGKSYIPTEIAQLFPPDDIIEVGYCSPTAFFHMTGEFSKEKGGYTVDLSRKILIFLDQPHTLLLQHLRPLLSHDKKELQIKITDKSQKGGLKTKNIFLKGFPAVIFCTAGLKIDEQETTRFLLLSPETNGEKIREAIFQKIKKETDGEAYRASLEADPARRQLKERILAVRQEKIMDIKISSPEKIQKAFLTENKTLKPRHQRDIGRIISLVKAFALLNLWFRDKNGSTITANEEDIEEAFKVWNVISESQEFNLPPYIYQIFKEVIVPAYTAKNQKLNDGFEQIAMPIGLTRREITQSHLKVHGRVLADWSLRQQIIPMLENSGLIAQEQDANDKRKVLIYPTASLASSEVNKNIVSDAGEEKIDTF